MKRASIGVVLVLVCLLCVGCSGLKPEVGGGGYANIAGKRVSGHTNVSAQDGLTVSSGVFVPEPEPVDCAE